MSDGSSPASRGEHMLTALQAAVLLEMDRVTDASMELFLLNKQATIELLCESSDVMMFGGKPKGRAAQTFTAIAHALAHMAYNPGGVYFAGLHWCRSGHRGKPMKFGTCREEVARCA